MKFLLTFLLLALFLTACSPVIRQAVPLPAPIPPGEAGGPPMITPQATEKVVEMITATPGALTPTAVPTQPSLPTVTSTSPVMPKTLAEIGVQAATYRDEVAGLAFDYPADWIINSLPDADKASSYIYTVTLRSGTRPAGDKQQEGIPPGMTAIDISVIKNGAKTLEQAINERRSSATTSETGQTIKIVAEEDWTLPGGLKAHRFLFDLGSDPNSTDPRSRNSSEMVAIIKDKMILVSGWGDQSLFNIIAASLREIP